MREIFEAINEYPWTTFFIFIMLVGIGNAFSGRKR
jgi:hypothetical protein